MASPTLSRITNTGARAGALAVTIAMVGWGLNNVVVKLTSVPALTFSMYRLWLGALMTVGVTLVAGHRLSWNALKASAPGGALLGFEIMFFVAALKQTSVADVTMIGALPPVLVLLVAGRMFGESVGRREVVLAAASLLGVVLVTVGSSGTPDWSLRGDALAVGALFAWTAYLIVSKRTRTKIPTLPYMSGVMLAAAVVATPFALASGEPLTGITAANWGWLLLFVVVGSGGHMLVAWAHPRVDISVSSMILLGVPVMSAFAALVFLGESIAPLEVVGGLIVLAAVAEIVRHATRAGGAEAEEIAAAETPPG